MLDPVLRPLKDRLLAPLAAPMAPVVHPLVVTVVGFAVGMACAVSLYLGHHAVGLALWAGNRLLDGLDGPVARAAGRQTDLGAYIDILLDFAVYAAIPIALAHGRSSDPDAALGLALALLLAGFYVNAASWMYLSAVLAMRRTGDPPHGPAATGVEMPAGLVEGTETMVFFIAFIVFPDRLQPLFISMGILIAATIAQRLVWAVRHLPADPARP